MLTAPVMKSTQTATRPEPRKRNSNYALAHTPTITHNQEPKTITHYNEKIALVLFLASGFAIYKIQNMRNIQNTFQ